jgi:predicted DNA-binding transcriptional regulator YafY
MRGDQLVRQWCLLQRLGRSEGSSVEDGARELRCTTRTVWRDLRALQDAGFPIYDERDGHRGVWKVEEKFLVSLPVPLSLSEVVALLVSRDLLDPLGAGPFTPAVASALMKLRALLTPRALEVVDRMRASVGARAPGAKLGLAARDHTEQIERALAERRTLRLRYYSLSRDAETDRRIDPYHLTYFNGGAYLVAYCHLRREVRVFAVERIRSAAVLRETFVIPPDFDVQAYLRDAWGIVRGQLIAVRAAFSRAMAPYIRERLWHPSQEFRELAGGRLELRLRVADTGEVRRWLLGFGAEAEVLEPRALRETIAREAQRLAATLAGARKPPARAVERRTAARPRTPIPRPVRRAR